MKRRATRPGEPPRAPLEQAIGLRFKHDEEFVEELATNVSTGGMFVRARRPHPVGSVFEFELRLADGRRPIAGKAQVAWVRRRSQHLDEPVGMGVRFVELDDASRRQIAELVPASGTEAGRPAAAEPAPRGPEADEEPAAERRAEDEPPAPWASAPPVLARPAAPPPPPAMAGAASAAEADGFRRWRRALLALLAVVALAGVLWWRPLPVPAASGGAASEANASAPAAVAPAPAADAAAEPTPAPLRAVESWARAWSEQRVDDYLAAYSSRFTPAGGIDRAAWERQRRSRVLAPGWIEVALALVELEELSADRCRVSFVQAYESESYRDVVRKALELERGPDGWKIVRETVEL